MTELIRRFDALPLTVQRHIWQEIAHGQSRIAKQRRQQATTPPEERPKVRALAYMREHKTATTMQLASHLERPGNHLFVIRTMQYLLDDKLVTVERKFNKQTNRWQKVYTLVEEN